MKKTSRRTAPADPLSALPRAGRGSALIRELRGLLRSAAARRRRRVLVLEGTKLAAESLSDPARLRQIVASPRLLRDSAGRALARRLPGVGAPAHRVDDQLLSSLADVESHQGILVVRERPRWTLPEALEGARSPLVLVAHGIQDPGNLGALARVAEAAWASALVCVGGADPWSPRAIRASAGSLLRLPVLESPRAEPPLRSLREAGLRLAGTVPREGRSYIVADLDGPLAVVVGSEGAGLGPALAAEMDLLVSIPLRPGVESLNVASAAAVILFHRAHRQR